jgi:outer membrane biosynthesis protein TonB
VSAPSLRWALAASAVLHLGLLGALVVRTHPPATSAAMRVFLASVQSGAGEPFHGSGQAPGTDAPRPGLAGGAARQEAHVVRRAPEDTGRDAHPDRGSEPSVNASAVAQLAAVEEATRVRGGPAPATSPSLQRPLGEVRRAPEEPPREVGSGGGPTNPEANMRSGAATGASTGGGGSSGTGESIGTDVSPRPGGSTGTSESSLLEALSRRLAWSAERCAPQAAVRLARHGVPGVPLRFCLDAAGRPSGVGLLGTTGSELLDRAARDCVVPGALPLPPAPGCYTVEVRFPSRG